MFSQTVIVGNLGKDPESKFTTSGKQITTFNVAVNKKTSSGEEKTTWFRVSTFDTVAENCEKYLAKGSKVLVVGTVEASAWLDKNKEARATLELSANNVRFLDSKDKAEVADEPPPF